MGKGQRTSANKKFKSEDEVTYGISTQSDAIGIDTIPNLMHGVSTVGNEITPVHTDGIETAPNEVYGINTNT